MRNPFSALAVAFALVGGGALTQAETIVWSNPEGGDWTVAGNWSPPQVPGATDTAIINRPGTYSVTVQRGGNAGRVELGADADQGTQTLIVAGGDFRFDGLIRARGVIELQAGTLTCVGTNNVLDGTLNWSAGIITGNGASLTIAPTGTLNLRSGANHDLLALTLINQGIVQWTGGAIRIGRGTQIQNESRWVASVTNELNAAFGGTYAFNNSGRFEVLDGLVDFRIVGTSTGTFDVATNAVCQFLAGYQFDDGTAFTGAGINRLVAGTTTLNGLITSENLNLAGGDVVGEHTLSGTYDWQGSVFRGGGTTTIVPDATLNIVTGANHDLIERTLINTGTIRWNAGGIRTGRGSRIENQGRWVCAVNSEINVAYGSAAAFNNPGRFEVTEGVVVFKTGGSGSGVFDVAAGARCEFATDYRFGDGTAFIGEGVNRLSQGNATLEGPIISLNLELAGGTITGNHSLIGVYNWTGSKFTGAGGTTVVGANATLNIITGNDHDVVERTFINAGTIRWRGGAVRTGQGSRIENQGIWVAEVTNQINTAYGGTTAFNNPGRFVVVNGSVNFALTGASSGTFDTGTNSVCQFTTNYQFNDGTTFVGAGINRLAAGLLTLNGRILSDNLELAGGNLVGDHTLLGTFNWLGSVFQGTKATTLIAPDSILNIRSNFDHDLVERTLINRGTVLWTGGAIRNGRGSRIENEGTWIAQVTNQINAAYGGAPAFNNSGRFEVVNGSINIALSGTNTGTFDTGTNSLCQFTTNYQFDDGTAFTGAGVNRLTAGTLTLNGEILSENLELAGGQLEGNHTLLGTVDWLGSQFRGAGETTTIGPSATLNILTGNDHDVIERTMTNLGTIHWTGGAVRSGRGSRIENEGTWVAEVTNSINAAFGGVAAFNNPGRFEVVNGSVSLALSGNSTGTFDTGTNSLTQFTTDYHFDSGTAFTGAGINRLAAGTLTLSGEILSENLELAGGNLEGNHTFFGTVDWVGSLFRGAGGTTTVGPGAILTIASNREHDIVERTLINAGTVQWLAGSIRTGRGTQIENQGRWLAEVSNQINTAYGGTSIFINSGTLEADTTSVTLNIAFNNPGGTLAVTGGGALIFPGELELPAGRVTGSGTIQARSIVSSAVIRPGAPGAVLTLAGDFQQLAGGRTEFDLNETDYSRINITGTARLDGLVTLRYPPGYSPEIGVSYEVLTAGKRVGEFAGLDNSQLPDQDKLLTGTYSPTGIAISAVADPGPLVAPMTIRQEGFPPKLILTWPPEFSAYPLYTRTNLTEGVWILIPGATNTFFEISPTDPQRFFRRARTAL